MHKVKRVLVYGKFRVVHAGHIRLFSHALDLGEELAVGILAEERESEQVRFSEMILRNLPMISEVFIDSNPSELIRKFKPNLIVKGLEHRETLQPELEAIEEIGAKVVYTSGDPFFSSNEIFQDVFSDDKIVLSDSSDYINRNSLSFGSISELVEGMKRVRVLVVGDLIVDEYIGCHPIGMSQEEPVIVNARLQTSKYVGGAGIVAAHCAGLGAKVEFLSVVGDDETANWSEQKLKEFGVTTRLFRDGTRPTTCKQRYVSSKQTLFRLSHFKQQPLDSEQRENLITYLGENLERFDIVICSDFSYGVLTDEIANFIVERTKKGKIQISADSQSSSQIGNLSKFNGVDHVFATEREARLELKNDLDGLAVLVGKLRRELEVNNVILKLGGDGVLFEGRQLGGVEVTNTEQIPALNKRPRDISGAGDSMLAATSLALAAGGDLYESVFIGSLASAIQVSRQGNVPITLERLKDLLKSSIPQ